MTSEDLLRIMDEYPDLNTAGMGVANRHSGKKSPEQRVSELASDRAMLLKYVHECNRAVEWLDGAKKIGSFNWRTSSLTLKNIIEKDVGDLLHGSLIAAVIHCGFKVKPERDYIHVYFNISQKSINERVAQRQSTRLIQAV